MPITNNTMSTWTATANRSDADISLIARQEAKDVLQADTAIQFLKYLVANDPDFRDKFTAFRVATRIGAVI